MPYSKETIFERIAKIRGNSSEKRVKDALYFLKGLQIIDGSVASVSLDRRNIDFLVSKGSKKYKLQVKSSEKGMSKGKEEYLKRFPHPDIIFIAPKRDENKKDLAKRINSMIESFEISMHQKKV